MARWISYGICRCERVTTLRSHEALQKFVLHARTVYSTSSKVLVPSILGKYTLSQVITSIFFEFVWYNWISGNKRWVDSVRYEMRLRAWVVKIQAYADGRMNNDNHNDLLKYHQAH